MSESWFSSWFDSKYYHILYQHRNEEEAAFFINNLVDFLQLPKGKRILDLACGKGRHSIQLQKLGYEVLGVDLAAESIAAAQAFANASLQFSVHDMREPLKAGSFDAVFNLFTSFGYFENREEHLQTLKAMRSSIFDNKGLLVIDFMNAYKAIQQLVLKEEKELDGILFKLRRKVENGYIVKTIRFNDRQQAFRFEERVAAFQLEDFQQLLKDAGLDILHLFGNYALEAFDKVNSPRLILVAKAC